MEERLADVSRVVGVVRGAIALVLTSRRGLTRSRLLVWASELRSAADMLERASRGDD